MGVDRPLVDGRSSGKQAIKDLKSGARCALQRFDNQYTYKIQLLQLFRLSCYCVFAFDRRASEARVCLRRWRFKR